MPTSNAPPNSPRYLPTLTEVVNPRDLTGAATAAASPSSPPAVPAQPDPAAIARQLLQTLTPVLEQQLRTLAQDLLESHLQTARTMLQQHIEVAVKRALDEAQPKRD